MNDNQKQNVNTELTELITRVGGELNGILDRHVAALEESLTARYADDVRRAAQRLARQGKPDGRVSIDPQLFSRIVNVLAVIEANELVDTDQLMDRLVADARCQTGGDERLVRVVHGAEHACRAKNDIFNVEDWWRG